jgi:hypothetical protein
MPTEPSGAHGSPMRTPGCPSPVVVGAAVAVGASVVVDDPTVVGSLSALVAGPDSAVGATEVVLTACDLDGPPDPGATPSEVGSSGAVEAEPVTECVIGGNGALPRATLAGPRSSTPVSTKRPATGTAPVTASR